MKTSLLLMLATVVIGGGCRMLADMQQSAFFSRFVLDKSVKAIAYKGIDATRGPGGGGGVGGSTGGIGLGGKDVRSSSTTSTSFDESNKP